MNNNKQIRKSSIMKIVAALGVLTFSCLCVIAAGPMGPVPPEAKERLAEVYAHADEQMKQCSSLYAAQMKEEKPKGEYMVYQQSGIPRLLEVQGDLFVAVWADSFRVVIVVNNFLDRQLWQAKAPPPVSTSSMDQNAAVERAKECCKAFEVAIPPHFKLTEAKFNINNRWHVRWQRFCGEYVWDERESSESVFVSFHEKDGLESISAKSCQPEPKSLDVKVSKEQATTKASKCVSLVQQSPIYRRYRMPGFVVKSLKSCELRIAVPNWFFDPKRAEVPRKEPAKETRLCWIVRFETVDSKAEQRGLKDKNGKPLMLNAPTISIYIDAATGDVVGALFT